MKPHELLPWQRQAILDAYAAGEKLEALCAEFNVCVQYPRELAKRRGHAIRPAGRPKRKQFKKPVLEYQVAN